jgi:hypothetical protein
MRRPNDRGLTIGATPRAIWEKTVEWPLTVAALFYSGDGLGRTHNPRVAGSNPGPRFCLGKQDATVATGTATILIGSMETPAPVGGGPTWLETP